MAVLVTCVVVVAILAVVGGFISLSNEIKRSELKVRESESGIDVALTKRFDVLTKMLDVVKEYEKYEKDTILETVKIRTGMTMSERGQAEAKMEEAFKSIKLTAEAYPQLKASDTFVKLQSTVADSEEHLQAARRAYNANVNRYNERIVTFPSSMVAGFMGATTKEYYQAEAEKRQDVKMQF